MKIFFILLSFAFIVTCKQKKEKKPQKEIYIPPQQTMVTFVVAEQINLKLAKTDPSLTDAIELAQELQQTIREIFIKFCIAYQEETNEDQCQERIQSGQYQMQAEYYHLRGDQLFKTFIVEFQMSLTIKNIKHVGNLIDQFEYLVDDGDIKMSEVSWEDEGEESVQEQILDQGVQKAQHACKNLGMKLHRIKSVKIVEKTQEDKKVKKPEKSEDEGQEEEQQQEEQPQEQDSGDDEEEIVKYKFVALCRKPQPKKISFKNLIPKTKVKTKKQ